MSDNGNYWLVVGALRCVAKKIEDGVTLKEALEQAASDMVDAAKQIDESRELKAKIPYLCKETDRLILIKEQLLLGNFDPNYKQIKDRLKRQGAKFEGD